MEGGVDTLDPGVAGGIVQVRTNRNHLSLLLLLIIPVSLSASFQSRLRPLLRQQYAGRPGTQGLGPGTRLTDFGPIDGPGTGADEWENRTTASRKTDRSGFPCPLFSLGFSVLVLPLGRKACRIVWSLAWTVQTTIGTLAGRRIGPVQFYTVQYHAIPIPYRTIRYHE